MDKLRSYATWSPKYFKKRDLPLQMKGECSGKQKIKFQTFQKLISKYKVVLHVNMRIIDKRELKCSKYVLFFRLMFVNLCMYKCHNNFWDTKCYNNIVKLISHLQFKLLLIENISITPMYHVVSKERKPSAARPVTSAENENIDENQPSSSYGTNVLKEHGCHISSSPKTLKRKLE
ncbi:Protein of unknown function, partial [Gryllus bimaculatus]